MKTKPKIAIVSSSGGHLTEALQLYSTLEKYGLHFYINHKIPLPEHLKDKSTFIVHSERDWKFIINLCEAFYYLLKNRPKVLLSFGAGPIVPFALVGKYIFGIKIIYIETFCAITEPSMTGKIMYRISDFFGYQWEDLKRFFPNGNFVGQIF